MLGIKPTRASDARYYQLIDIRPELERYSGMGFVAGSLCMPRSNELRHDAEALQRIAGNKIPVLVCLTGHRAHGLALAMAKTLEFPLGYVDGGLLAWNADGLPLAGLRLADELHTPLGATKFEAMVRLQLDALLVDVELDARDPVELVLQRCMLTLGRPVRRCAPHELRTLLDLLAVVLLDLDVARAEVSDLLDRLVLRLPSAWQREELRG